MYHTRYAERFGGSFGVSNRGFIVNRRRGTLEKRLRYFRKRAHTSQRGIYEIFSFGAIGIGIFQSLHCSLCQDFAHLRSRFHERLDSIFSRIDQNIRDSFARVQLCEELSCR